MTIHASPSREHVTRMLEIAPLYWRPILEAVRDHGVQLITLPQSKQRFDAGAKPTIVIVGDDLFEALGPEAFHRKSLRRFISTCRSAVIVACEPLPVAYMATATAAVLGMNAILIETLPHQQQAWTDLVQETKPDIALLVCAVHPENGERQ